MRAEDIRFEEAKEKVIGVDRQRFGIGTYGEKSVHAILKNYFEMDEDKQEIPIGHYIADIYRKRDGMEEIVEIQTSQFYRMKGKLAAFLPDYQVTVVYPVAVNNWIIWIDEDSGELKEKRKYSKKGNPYFVFPELYRIKDYLHHPHLKIKILLLDVEEYRILDGYGKNKKAKATKFDRIPIRLHKEIELERPEDYVQFLPYELEDDYTVKEFAKATKIPVSLASITLHLLTDLGAVERVGKKGNAYLYR
jgi:hypothetical protein